MRTENESIQTDCITPLSHNFNNKIIATLTIINNNSNSNSNSNSKNQIIKIIILLIVIKITIIFKTQTTLHINTNLIFKIALSLTAIYQTTRAS